MAGHRIHCVEKFEDEEGHTLIVVKALCGRFLLSEYTCMHMMSQVDTEGGMNWDEYTSFRRRARVYPTHDRPFYTIEEFCLGEDGVDSIDCGTCRKLMYAAIQRYWKN